MMKKLTLLCLTLLLCLSLFPAAIMAAESPTYSMSVSENQTNTGHDFRVTVKGDDLVDLYSYEINVTYDTKLLKFKKAVSSMTGFSVPAIVKDGKVTFAHTKVGPKSGENGTVELAVLTFESIKNGDADIQLTSVKNVDSQLKATDYTPNVKLSVKPSVIEKTITFSDIIGHWAQKAIEKAAGLGIVNGYEDGTFHPEGQVTRAEFTAMLLRAVDVPANGGVTLNFTDVDSIPNWGRSLVSEAVNAGIVSGYDDNTFRPNQLISRAEMAVMVMRAAGIQAEEGSKSSFADTDDIPDWANPLVASAVSEGLIHGRDNNMFVPFDNATRAEAVTMIMSLVDRH
ncbi:S-layer homology domain-containing protein [Paenibacillus hexagrammi]|uniref:S-layer homology domain-containing protein n=1 Tax=Paenibacillus hexagrammi TaxID=2908839 RepID=A0ABY3SNG6_9BACL|nr:S-layer homology domain-containing protein [Paenibacillus sp. YPD9-1]UJF34980.1 S-layer homology domain-containing protein [Paenibacillus sp. YPD9-1]